MQNELLNLLPSDRIRTARREYFIRLAVVAVLALAGLVIANGVLLVPTYLSLHDHIRIEREQIALLDHQLADTQGKETNQRLTALADSATYLARLATTTSATAAVRGVLAVPRTGITLSGFTYSPPVAAGKGKMSLRGVAATRESLQAYHDALAALPFISVVDLPISAYAKESDIPFTIALSGTLIP